MPDASLGLLILIIILAIGFGFTNGLNDAANAIATSVGSRVLSPKSAVIISAFANLAGAATGTAVARTIGKGILTPDAISFETVIAALSAVIIWTLLATYWGLPVSLTHGFVAGLAAAGFASLGADAVAWDVLGRVAAAIVTAPVLGFIGGFLLMIAVFWIFRRTAPARVRRIFSNLQVLSAAFVAYSHGKNDGQMPIGVITMALVAGGYATWEAIPWWVIIVSALAISSGTAIGGWRVMKTLGFKMTSLKPDQGFISQFSAASVIELASHLGIPVSTTHCTAASIMGVGAIKRFSAVRWGIAGNIVTAWVVTFPICGVLSFLIAKLFGMF